MGILTPNIEKDNSDLFDESDGAVSIIEWIESRLHPWSSFVIVPLFAFANTGVVISHESIAAALDSPVAWGIFIGFVAGKPLGIFATIYLSKL